MTNSPATSLRRYDWGEGGAATLLTTVHHAPTYTDLVWHSDSSTDFGKAGIMARKYSSRNGILPFCEGADQSVSTTTVRVPCRGGEAGEGFVASNPTGSVLSSFPFHPELQHCGPGS